MQFPRQKFIAMYCFASIIQNGSSGVGPMLGKLTAGRRVLAKNTLPAPRKSPLQLMDSQKVTERHIILTSLAETDRLGRMLGAHLPPRAVCLLRGDLAAGKTTLIKSICAAFGIDPKTVISPTYTLVNWYEGGALPCPPICHVDFYRLERTSELRDMDQDDWLNPDGPTFIEWPDVALPLLAEAGAPVLEIALAQPDDAEETVRRVTLSSNDAAFAPLFAALADAYPAEAPC